MWKMLLARLRRLCNAHKHFAFRMEPIFDRLSMCVANDMSVGVCVDVDVATVCDCVFFYTRVYLCCTSLYKPIARRSMNLTRA